ncbi:MAG TPA: hypothetical protein VGS79_23925 [Puia sp.]|nr:hypothetical protein [Puia sp.]
MTPEGSTPTPPGQQPAASGSGTGQGNRPSESGPGTGPAGSGTGQPQESLPAPYAPAGSLPAPEQAAGALPPPMERFTAKPAKLPMPTYWPFFLAMGIAFIGWGLISTWVLTVGGGIVFIISLIGWINILRHEQQ